MGQGQRQLVVFSLDTEVYAINIEQVREIIRVPQVTRVPRSPDFVEGVINLRGTVIPVINLRQRFQLGEPDPSLEERIIVIESGDHWIGMRVDDVSEVLRMDADRIEPPSPHVVGDQAEFVVGIAQDEDRLIILLDLGKVLYRDEALQLDALREQLEQDMAAKS